jgi:hypothetical protein
MQPYQYVISLRIWHPSMPHEDITSAIGVEPKHNWNVGEPRVSPRGNQLGGTRTSSYWSAPLVSEPTSSETKEIEETLRLLLARFRHLEPFFLKLRREGGKSEFFVGLYSDNNIVIDLEPKLMALLASASLSICLDYYPWKKS